MAIVRALLLAAAVAGCGGLGPFEPPTPANFTSYLEDYGQRFTPRPAPTGAADWRGGVPIGFPYPGAQVAYATYGEISCVDPSKNCERGLVGLDQRPDQTLAIWVISFVDTPASEGCPLWATVDAKTGAFLNGAGPPCA
jgi:hypothetical protein